jgi:pyruvate formate lyase activating enzyme
VPLTDLFLWDIKLTDSEAHRSFTGVSNELIIENLTTADKMEALTRIRCILVNGVNTFDSHYDAVAETVLSLKHCEGVELIPYHAYGGSKAVLIGRENNGNADWIPSDETICFARATLENKGVRVL